MPMAIAARSNFSRVVTAPLEISNGHCKCMGGLEMSCIAGILMRLRLTIPTEYSLGSLRRVEQARLLYLCT